MKAFGWIALLALMFIGGGVLLPRLIGPGWRLPDGPALVTRIQETARLETLRVSLYEKIDFAPHPESKGSLLADAVAWARYSIRSPRGRAIVFADVTLGFDLAKLDASRLHVRGDEVFISLPHMSTLVELKPGETEVLGSNLDTAETAALLEVARERFERRVADDEALRSRARSSAERTLQLLCLSMGYSRVHFVEKLPVLGAGGAG